MSSRTAGERIAEERIDWRQVRLVLAARWRIVSRRMAGKPVLLALELLLRVAFALGVVAFSVAVAFGVRYLVSTGRIAEARGAVHLVHATSFVFLALTPVLGFRGNEFLDVTKLLTFPVTHRTVFASSLLSLLASGSVFAAVLPVVAVATGYAGTVAGAVLGVLAGLLLVATSVALGQVLLLVFLDRLRSRKWRDVTMVVVPLLTGGVYAGSRILFRGEGSDRETFLALLGRVDSLAGWLVPLPSWWSAHAVTGGTWARLAPALAMVPLLVWLVRVAARLQERTYHGEVEDAPRTLERSGTGRGSGLLRRVVRDPVAALAEKDIALLRREPAVRTTLIGQFTFALVPVGLLVWNVLTERTDDPARAATVAAFAGAVSYVFLLAEMAILLNVLGLQGGGLVHTLLTPVRRRDLLLGKDVAHLVVFGTINAAVAVTAVVVAHVAFGAGSPGVVVTRAALGAVEAYAAAALVLGIGDVMSVLLPYRLAAKDRRALRQQTSTREGCLRTLLGLAGVALAASLLVPLFLAFHQRDILGPGLRVDSTSWLLLTVPLGIGVAAAVLAAGATLGGSLLERREEQAISVFARSEE